MATYKPTAIPDEEMHAAGQRGIGLLKQLGIRMPVEGFFSAGVPQVIFRDLTRPAGAPLDPTAFGSRVTLGAGILTSGQSPFPVDPFHLTIVRWGPDPDQCGQVTVGPHTCLSGGAIVSYADVRIGDRVLFGPNVVMMDCDGAPADTSRPPGPDNLAMQPVVIEDNAWIGWNAIIMPGVTIGHHATVAAQAVVTKDIPPHCLAMGNPARVVTRFVKE